MNSETYYINILYNRGNIINNVNKYLLMNSGEGYLKLSKLCFNNDILKKVINYPAFYSNDFEKPVCSLINLDKLGLNKIALFYSSLVSFQADTINSFIIKRDQFETHLLLSQYEDALDILIDIYNQFGLSLWLIGAYSIVLNLTKKSESKDELSHIRNNQFFKLFIMKNNPNLKHSYYLKQISEILNSSELDNAYLDYLKYLYFVLIPDSKQEWHNILLYSSCFSFIDMYLCLIDYLQRVFCTNTADVLALKCMEYIKNICEVRLSQIKKTVYNIQDDNNEYNSLLIEFDSNNYDSVIRSFYTKKKAFFNTITMYLLVAVSFLFTDSSKQCEKSTLLDMIVELMYRILMRDESVVDDILRLAALSRILKAFTIHKGLCVYLDIVANFGFGYSLNEMYSTGFDYTVKQYEEITDNIHLIPYLCKRNRIRDSISEKFLNAYKSKELITLSEKTKTYFREGYTILEFNRLNSLDKTNEAISLFLNAYINNKILVFLVDVSGIEAIIKSKIENRVELSIDEVCYVFVDSNLKEYRDDCFLEVFDSIDCPPPIDVIKHANTTEEIKAFFLFEICTTNRLSSLYFMFLSGEAAEDYRFKICNELIKSSKFRDKKHAQDEIERITKRRMLSKRIRRIDESKLIINADALKKECHNSIIEKIDLFNNSYPLSYRILTTKSNDIKLQLIDNHRLILESIYNIYCKEFCFGKAGLDISLSTRVRHGTLTNQLIKVFSDHDLLIDGNKLGNTLQSLMQISENKEELSKLIKTFNESVNQILEVFVKSTLKVFIDTPIDGAVFDYRYSNREYENIFGNLPSLSKITFDEVTSLINYYIVEKTNKFLKVIREKSLIELENDLLSELDLFSKAISDHFYNHSITQAIEGKIITCKTDIQNQLKTISNWFVLSEYNQWESFYFSDIVQTCKEIDKTLFSGYDSVSIEIIDGVNIKINGKFFREFVDVILIILNNAIEHSGYRDDLSHLKIKCSFFEDTESYYMSFENTLLSEKIDVNKLQDIIDRINGDFYCQKFLHLNVRQEGGMGLYKIMHIVFSVLKVGKDFFISQIDNRFRIELKLTKEIAE